MAATTEEVATDMSTVVPESIGPPYKGQRSTVILASLGVLCPTHGLVADLAPRRGRA